ncbi:PAS domain-containing protein [Burkholderiaceae bacterium DAT-1]|nr:PAS domain-containing protein [Burkholderiaceae bacterium DAT-1]
MRDYDFIISKTDAKGRLVYANQTFIEFSGFSEAELLGQQHNIVRHPDMPRGVFKLLWDTLTQGKEIFAYVKNMQKDGGFYWVFANVTPDYDPSGNIIGYFSVRRAPRKPAVQKISVIYQQMIDIEKQAGPKHACEASLRYLNETLAQEGMTYENFILAL